MLKQEFKNVAVLLVIVILITLFVLTNIDQRVGIIFFSFGVLGLIIFLNADKFKGLINKMIGIEFLGNTDWLQDLATGILFGLLFIIIKNVFPQVSIGIPAVDVLAVSGITFFSTIILAPIIEEIVFRGVIQGFLRFVGLPLLIAILLTSFGFSITHYTAYTVGGYVSNVNTFVGAGLFGLFSSILATWRKSLLPSIIMHMFVNIIIVSKMMIAG